MEWEGATILQFNGTYEIQLDLRKNCLGLEEDERSSVVRTGLDVGLGSPMSTR